MLQRAKILVVEDEPATAMYIAAIIEDHDGEVVGPVPTVSEALAVIAKGVPITGAVLDNLLGDGNVTPVALKLVADAVPLVIYSGVGIPPELAAVHPDLPVILKPAKAEKVVTLLADLILSMKAQSGSSAESVDQYSQTPGEAANNLGDNDDQKAGNDQKVGDHQKTGDNRQLGLNEYIATLEDELDAHKVIMAHLYCCLEGLGLSRTDVAHGLKDLRQEPKLQKFLDSFADGILASVHEASQSSVSH